MDIVCSIDNNYVQHCCCMLVSFFENNKGEKHSIHLLSDALTLENQKVIKELVESYQGVFSYYSVDPDKLLSCPIKATDHLTIATYYRLLMVTLLPQELKKVLYLDCDIVVDGSLKEFWDTSLKGYALAAVDELNTSAKDVYERLEYDEKYGYFNAGVLLVNLEYWRSNNLTEVFFDYISSHYDKIRAHDQDVLNALLHDKCRHVSQKWNVEESFYHYYVIKEWRKRDEKEMKSVLLHPVIPHYSWKPKPWEQSCRHPFRLKYFFYLSKVDAFSGCKLTFGEKLQAYCDEYYFKLVLRLGIRGHRFYKL